jgi:NADH-quinone oxidoreductase subunit L
VGLVTAGLTAFYMWRLMALTFFGESRVATDVHVDESPKIMTVPLIVLAAGSVLAGWVGVPKLWSIFPQAFRTLEVWLGDVLGEFHAIEAVEHEPNTGLELGLMLLSIAVAGAGILAAWYLYQKRRPAGEPLEALGPVYRGASNKWNVDEAYDALFVNGLAKGGGTLLSRFDQNVVDGGVNGAGWLTRATSKLSMWWDTWVIDGAVRLSSFGVKLSSYPVRILQTGSVQAYALIFLVGMVAVFGYYMVR